MLERMKVHVDNRLREEQAGFRNGKSCADQIATLRNIIEQSIGFQTSLYLNFKDFEKAIDSTDHQVLRALVRLPEKFIRIHPSNHLGTLREPFRVTTGVRQAAYCPLCYS